MFGQSSQPTTTGIFGTSSAPSTTTTTTFGHQRSNTSLFTPAAGPTSAAPFSFNASAPTTSAPAASAPSLFGSTTTTAPAGNQFTFGNTTTTTTTTTPSLFGSAATTTNKPTAAAAPSTFSFGNTSTQQKPLFGSTTTTPSFFGSTIATQQQPSSLFGASQPQQQQQQQQQGSASLLSLQAAFPDTNVPYFTIRPDGINRTTFPSNFFVEETSSNNKKADTSKSSTNTFIYKGKETTITAPSLDSSPEKRALTSTTPSTSRPFGEKRKVLPGFLTGTSAQSSESAITGQKRFIDNNDNNNRRVLFKSTSSPASSSGIFGGQQEDAYAGFGKRRPTDINLDQPPVSSLWDVGVNPKPAIMSANLNDMKKNITMTRMNEHGIKSGTSTSVSIFGFPNHLTAQVLDYFTTFGDIVEKDLSDSGGNWMTLRYAKEESAKKALEHNGKILDGHFMVGVTPLISATTPSTNNTTTTTTTAPRSAPVVLAQPTQGVFKPNDKPVSSGLFGFFTKSTSSSSTTTSLPHTSSTLSSSLTATTTTSSSSEFTNERGQQVTKVVDDSYASWIRNHLRF